MALNFVIYVFLDDFCFIVYMKVFINFFDVVFYGFDRNVKFCVDYFIVQFFYQAIYNL